MELGESEWEESGVGGLPLQSRVWLVKILCLIEQEMIEVPTGDTWNSDTY